MIFKIRFISMIIHCSLFFFVYIGWTDLDKKEEWTFNKCSMYVNVDVQLFWKLLLTVWKATDHSVFVSSCHTLIRPTRKSVWLTRLDIIYYNHIDSNRFIE